VNKTGGAVKNTQVGAPEVQLTAARFRAHHNRDEIEPDQRVIGLST
jgi:hypothetical protein